ncbi:GrpB family protein [Clostridium botulinum]|uniref:GrpB family protein n=1 Tax=Clostridium botulinum TaxID=1491 RepID=UPI0007743883|nr:GrpB family protein [Clostridium botulinum]MBY6953238.1 GrpB family protein [Clostridium botulinum]MCR1138797.1 GrpB family protein [Clostridium botulinum]NEZ79793.1 GrpB family protein [Clostridium botulinum]NFA18009.1 GrpB family protein [Clostridium botulinum]NFA54385.1 GrpB family protein [Clostridium botulinum]
MRKSLSEMSLEELWMLFPIILEEHNPLWEDWYLEEKKLIMSIIEIYNIERINHIGSTSVNRLIAKPTIDILLEITRNCDLKFLVNVLEENGYIFEKQPQKPAPHMMFMKGYTEKGFAEKVFHLHVRYLGDWDELYFRDYLQSHTDISQAYGDLKIALKDKYEHNRDGYTEAKTEFIRKYTTIAKIEFNNKYSSRE